MATTDMRLSAAIDRLAQVPERGKLRTLNRRQLCAIVSDVRVAADELASYSKSELLKHSTSWVLPDGTAIIAHDDLLTVVGALSDSAVVRLRHQDHAGFAKVRALSRVLGDDRD